MNALAALVAQREREGTGVHYLARRRSVRTSGLAGGSQHSKLLSSRGKFNCIDIGTLGADGKPREMLAMPIEKLPLWLASINPNKIKSEASWAKVERYQAESAESVVALHELMVA